MTQTHTTGARDSGNLPVGLQGRKRKLQRKHKVKHLRGRKGALQRVKELSRYG